MECIHELKIQRAGSFLYTSPKKPGGRCVAGLVVASTSKKIIHGSLLTLRGNLDARCHCYHGAHDAMRWKLEGLSDYDLRRPLTPTGTSLLGIVKHVAWVELGYFGDVFDRPHGVPMPENADEINADMYVRADESVDEILALFATAQAHANATLDAAPDTTGAQGWKRGGPAWARRVEVVG